MLDAGMVFCYKCGKPFSGLHYYNGEVNLQIQVKRNLFGKRFVELDPDTDEEIKKTTSVKLDESVMNFTSDINNELTVRVKNSDVESTLLFSRCCPNCVENRNEQTQIISSLGLLPTYIIGVMGAPAVGKSCWIHSTSVTKNLIGIRSSNKGLYRLEPTKVNKESAQIAKTAFGSTGETNVLLITENATKKPVAAVMLTDMAGEMFAPENRKRFKETAAYCAFQSGMGFDGVDAVLFMDAPDDNGLTDAYNQVSETKVLTNKPVAYVLNKVDTLFDTPPRVPLSNSDESVPLFTEKTFFTDPYSPYGKENLIRRISLQTYIARNYKGLAKKILLDNENSAGFLIKTCSPVSQTIVSFADSINVMDPLLWILNKLDIFPIQ